MAPLRSIALFLAAAMVAASVSLAGAAIVEHTFRVGNMTVHRLCSDQVVTAVNEQVPGPTIDVTEGDTVVVHVINNSPYGITIHWHGVLQMLSNWQDGAGMITQCPIQPGDQFTYRFNVTGQEGTLWWHAHVGLLRVTVHGALIIRPRHTSRRRHFAQPDEEATIILGEWWDKDLMAVEKELQHSIFDNVSSAFTINGLPGELYPCSSDTTQTYILKVKKDKIYLLRIINAGLDNEFFYKIANHSFTVVAIDACYTSLYDTDMIVIGPGQTVDVLLFTNAQIGSYYMAATSHITMVPLTSWTENTTTVGILQYVSNPSATKKPILPHMPANLDLNAAFQFYGALKGIAKLPPQQVDKKMFITIGFGSVCGRGHAWCELLEREVTANMNNISFQLPNKISILEAYYYKKQDGVYTTDFPDNPPLSFNYTSELSLFNHKHPDSDFVNKTIEFNSRGTKVEKVKYNTVMEIVIQSTSVIAKIDHHMHLHGHNFFVLAHGFGNYDHKESVKSYNLVDPPMRNTVTIPVAGWAVIRFIANNPGAWILHCHMGLHLSMGLATAIIVENGPTSNMSLTPPPKDFPMCSQLQMSPDHFVDEKK